MTVPFEQLGHFRILGPLGRGGMGEVYKAQDERLGRLVAIKVLAAQVVGDAERRRRFLSEARSAAAVNHPNIATIYEVGEVEGHIFIAMELIDGASLRHVMSTGRLEPGRALRFGVEMARALARAHEAGVVHRDLKPENVMVTADDAVKLVDFGLAKQVTSGPMSEPDPTGFADTAAAAVTREGQILGTPGYMAPEQTVGRGVGPGSDVFSLGVVLYEMLGGQAPFVRDTPMGTLIAASSEEPAPLASVCPAATEELSRIVHRCLAKDPARRYRSAGELLPELRAVVGGAATPGSNPSIPPAPVATASARPRWVVPLAAGVVLAAALAGVVFARSRAGDGPVRGRTEGQTTFAEKQLTGYMAGATPGLGFAVSRDEVFYRDDDGFWAQPLAGGTPRALNVPKSARSVMDVSSDGKHLLTTTDDHDLALIDLETKTLKVLYRFEAVTEAALSPAQDQVAVLDSRGVEVLTLAKGQVRLLVTASADGSLSNVTWSPEGNLLLYARIRTSTADTNEIDLEVTTTDGSRVQRLLTNARLWQRGGTVTADWRGPGEVVYVLAPDASARAELWSQTVRDGLPEGAPRLLMPLPVATVPRMRTVGSGFLLQGGAFQTDVSIAAVLDGGLGMGPLVRLTLSDFNERPSDWMADGGVLFVSDRAGNFDVFEQAPGQHLPRRIAESPANETWPQRTVGDQVLFWRQSTGDKQEFSLMRAQGDGAPAKELFRVQEAQQNIKYGRPPPYGHLFRCARAVDRCAIAEYEAGQLVFRWFDAKTGERSDAFRRELVQASSAMFDWALSPDAKRAAVLALEDSVSIFDLPSGVSLRYRAPPGARAQYGVWSPDGQRLYVTFTGPDGDFFVGSLGLDGTWTTLGRQSNTWIGQAVTSPDGASLAFVTQEYVTNLWLLTPAERP